MPTSHGSSGSVSPAGSPLKRFAASLAVTPEFLRSHGVTDASVAGQPALRIAHVDDRGRENSVLFLIEDGLGYREQLRSGDRPTIYGIPNLDDARMHGLLVIATDIATALVLKFHGIPAVAIPPTYDLRGERDDQLFDGIPDIIVVTVHGLSYLRDLVARSAFRSRVRLLELGDPQELVKLHRDNPDEFTDRFDALVTDVVPWTETEAARKKQIADDSWSEARELATTPDLMERIERDIIAAGHAGSPLAVLLVIIAIVSRFLAKPAHVAVVSPSASGKNATVDMALRFHPPEAVYRMSAGSQSSVIYNDKLVPHQVLYMGEADSLVDDGPPASVMRSLLSDGVARYDTVVTDPGSGQKTTLQIVLPGPLQFMTTGTRVLEIRLRDDPQQTKAVMRAQAQALSPTFQKPTVDFSAYHALQRWIEHGGTHDAVIPFGEALSERIPPTDIRLRRDFQQLLAIIQSLAILHQAQRELTDDGRVIATLEDYAHARRLLASVFDAVAAQGVTKAIRQTVAAIAPGEVVSQTQLGQQLKLGKSAVSDRVSTAIKGGWLVDEETRVGFPAQLRRGAPLPDETTALPTVEQVEAVLRGESMPPTMMTINKEPAIDKLVSSEVALPTTDVADGWFVTDPDPTVPDVSRRREGWFPFRKWGGSNRS